MKERLATHKPLRYTDKVTCGCGERFDTPTDWLSHFAAEIRETPKEPPKRGFLAPESIAKWLATSLEN